MRGSNPAGQGPTTGRRVGKSKKVVKRRGVGVLVFGKENCLGVKGGQWKSNGPPLVCQRVWARILGWCRVGRYI